MQILATCETAERERSPQESYREAQKYDKNAEHGNGNSSGFEVQKGPMVGGENRAALRRLELLADFGIVRELGFCSPSLCEDHAGSIIAGVVCGGRVVKGTCESGEKPISNERLAAIKGQHHCAVFPEKASSLAEAFKRVHVVVEPKSRKAG